MPTARAMHCCLVLLLAMWLLGGCRATMPDSLTPLQAYNFTEARDAVRPVARRRPMHENTILAYAELGMASLADGDLAEAEEALTQAYRLIESGETNDPTRILAATVIHDGVVIWKGEPFEQAVMLIDLAVCNALAGRWDEVRVAARAAVRRLEDYAEARSKENTGEPLEERFIDDFALGYLWQGLAQQVAGAAPSALDLAERASPGLGEVAERIRSGRFNTVLVVDEARGPVKRRTGADGAETVWAPRDRTASLPVEVSFEGASIVRAASVLNVNELAQEHRWITLAEARKAKSGLGTASTIGGVIVGSSSNDSGVQLIGLGLILGGLLMKASAQADIRQNNLLPSSIAVIPMELPGTPGSLEVKLGFGEPVVVRVPGVSGGTMRDPEVIYLRVFSKSRPPDFLAADELRYANDHDLPLVGEYPWILGGTCVATPSEAVLRVYHAGGYLLGQTVDDLKRLYAAEGIVLGSGPVDPTHGSNLDYRHVLLGGRSLYTPDPNTLGYKRLMYHEHPPYQPTSDLVRGRAEAIRARYATDPS